MQKPVYLDYQATTPVDPEVLEAMIPYFSEQFGNPASFSHSFGSQARAAVEEARQKVASLIGAKEKEIIFTSGATEANNLAILGIAEAYKGKGRHIITAATEHKAVLDPCEHLKKRGFEVTVLPVDRYGLVEPGDVQEAINDKTILITIMMANNEIGTIGPIAQIGTIAKQKGVIFHTDAAQAFGKIPVDVESLGVDLLSLTAHKMYGPKGIGALYVRSKGPRVHLSPIIFGGGHEKGLRSGTLNVPGCVGLGKACEIAEDVMEEECKRVLLLRDKLQDGILGGLEHVHLNGHPEKRLPNNLNLSFESIQGDALILALQGLAVSSGSACTSETFEPSHVLLACGVGEDLASSALRFSLGRFTTEKEIEFAIELVIGQVKKLYQVSAI